MKDKVTKSFRIFAEHPDEVQRLGRSRPGR